MKIITKIKKRDLVQFKSLFTAKERNKQPTEWGKIFANNATNKGLISKIYQNIQIAQVAPLHGSQPCRDKGACITK